MILKWLKLFLWGIIVTFLLQSCNSKSDPVNQLQTPAKHILKNSTGVFRNIYKTIPIDSVKLNETEATPKDEDSTYLFYEFNPDSNTQYSIEYSFLNTKLKDVRIDIYSKNPADSKLIFEELLNYFDSNIQKHYVKNQVYFWTVEQKMRLELIDESDSYGTGKLTILYYPEEESIEKL